jgi:hypothetical protein
MMIRRTGALLLLLPLAGLLAVGCPFAPTKTHDGVVVPPQYLPQSSAANCMENLKTAYNDRNFDEYIKLFASDFTFVFSQADWSRPDNPTPKNWGFNEEQTSTQNMFTDDTVQKIELSYVVNPVNDSSDEFPATWKIVQDKINLRLTTLKEDGTTLVLLVDAANDAFYFKEYADETASDGKPLWRIWRWEDEPLGGKMLAMNPPGAR